MSARTPIELNLNLETLRPAQAPAPVEIPETSFVLPAAPATAPIGTTQPVPAPADLGAPAPIELPLDLSTPFNDSWRDVGPQELPFYQSVARKGKSAAVALGAGAVDTAGSALRAAGWLDAEEAELRAWSTLPPEEREIRALEQGGRFVGGLAPDFLVGPELDQYLQDKGAEGARKIGELLGKFNQLEKEIIPGFWTRDLPHALGTTAAIGAAAVAGTPAGIPPWVTAGFLGATLGLDEGIQDALDHGATPEQANIAAGVGALLGTTEAIPITRVLDRVDTATGGVISRSLNRAIRNKAVGGVLKEGLKGAFEEGLQEAVQNIGMDTAAMLMYDPDREIGERAIDAAQAGGGTGFVLSAVASALGIRMRNAEQRRVGLAEARATAERMLGQEANEEGISRNAPFSGLMPAYFEAQQGAAETIKKLRELAAAARGERTLSRGELSDELRGPIGVEFGRGLFSSGTFEQDVSRLGIFSEVETALPKTGAEIPYTPSINWDENTNEDYEDLNFILRDPDEGTPLGGIVTQDDGTFQASVPDETAPEGFHEVGIFSTIEEAQKAVEIAAGTWVEKQNAPLSVTEALEKQPIVVAGFEKTQWEINDWTKKIQALEAEAKKFPSDESISAEIETAKGQLDFWKQRRKDEIAIAKEIKGVFATLRGKYLAPDTKIVISDQTGSPGSWGDMYSARRGRLARINIDVAKLANGTATNRWKQQAVEVALHEFGHLMVHQRFMDLQAKVESAMWTQEDLAKKMTRRRYLGEDEHLSEMLKYRQQQDATGKPVATQGELAAYHGVMEEYATWLEKRLKDPFIQRFRDITAPAQLAQWEWSTSSTEMPRDVSYFYNFDEFMAENFSRIGTQHAFVTEGAESFFKEMRDRLVQAYGAAANQTTMTGPTEWIRLMSYEGKIEKIVKKQAGEVLNRYSFMTNPEKAGEYGLSPDSFRDFEKNMDNYQRWYRYGLNILQLSELNTHIEPLQRYVRLARAYNSKIGAFRWQGHETLAAWRKIGKAQADLVGKVLYEETLNEKPMSEEAMRREGLGDDGVAVVKKIKADFASVLDRMEEVLLAEVRQNLYSNPVEMNAQLREVRAEIAKMRAKPFFPLMRFGRYTVRVTEKATGKLVSFETFEKGRHRKSELPKIRAKFPSSQYNVGTGYLTDAEVAVQGMQGPLLRKLREKLEQGGQMTPEMREAIDRMLKDSLPIESFKNHFTRRRKTRGYSEDATRSYAAYMMQAGTHLARIEMQADLNDAVNNTARDSREMAKFGVDGTKRGQIADMMREHLDYMFNPGNDWPMLRSAAFVWHLGFNLKSAFINSTQMFLATHPYLASRFGDVAATKALTKAVRDYTRYWDGNINKLTKEQQELLAKGKKDGWFDESLATELAIARSSNNLNEMLPVQGWKRTWSKFAEISAWPFHTVEKMNRGLTALATYDLAKDIMSHQQAMALARHAVESTQFEYARWARPKFMQGKVGSNLFLFKNYTQNMLFRAFGGNLESNRMIFSMLVLAGGMGLPFAEDLLDMLDVAGTKLKRVLGWSNPKVQSRQFIREMLLDMQMNPDLFMYGLGESSMGLGHLGDLMGVGVPEIDLQGSLSMGNVIPGTSALKRLQEGNPDQAFFDFIGELGGAEAGIMASVANGLLQDNPATWKRWETALPTALRQLMKAGRYAQEGREETARGQPIAEFDIFNVEDALEVAAQGLGFTPSRVSRGWETYIAEREVTSYYESWRRSLLRQHNYARLMEGSEAGREMLEKIKEYNKQVPYPEMRIGSDTLNRSLQEFARSRAEAGKSIPQQRQYMRLSKEIRELYEEN